MKTIKKLLSLAVSLMMVFSLMTIVKAESGSAIITLPNDGHKYDIYQIMYGDVAVENGTKVLSNAYWGGQSLKGYGTKVSESDLATITALSSLTDQAKLATLLKDYVNLNDRPYRTNEGYSADGTLVPTGYYLIKDNGNPSDNSQAQSLYIVQVVGPTTITAKRGQPTVVKKVYENSDGVSPNNAWQDGADYNIGDSVPFKLTATIGDNYDKYTTYYLRFNDTLSTGLKLQASSIEVTVDGTKLANDKYYIYGDQNNFQVVIYDLKTAAPSAHTGSTVEVTYNAILGTNAVIGQPGNPNEVYLTFSNNPNITTPTTPGGGTPGTPGTPTTPDTPDQPSNPGTPNEPSNPGETPKDKVVVFTYKVVVNKVDGSNNALKGAGFTLYKDGVAIGDELTGAELTQFVWTGLDAGTYTIKETTTPAGYNTAEDITFTIMGSYDTESVDPKLTDITILKDNTVISTGEDKVFTTNLAEGSATTDVVNNSGATLPSTGGMGTTMIYIGGASLMAVAAILLISKKRMSIQ